MFIDKRFIMAAAPKKRKLPVSRMDIADEPFFIFKSKPEENNSTQAALIAKCEAFPCESDYVDTTGVKAGKRDYSCVICHKPILKGNPSSVHKFYAEGDYPTYRTHQGKCSQEFTSKMVTAKEMELYEKYMTEELEKEENIKKLKKIAAKYLKGK